MNEVGRNVQGGEIGLPRGQVGGEMQIMGNGSIHEGSSTDRTCALHGEQDHHVECMNAQVVKSDVISTTPCVLVPRDVGIFQNLKLEVSARIAPHDTLSGESMNGCKYEDDCVEESEEFICE
jgi:hypothetical protein